ncbi:MAG: cyclic lactone autoinducer peptide [Lachnospiraceae bacterium]|nr:cyclic lactone autoinducer peptide [Lachnospiraceae bacterium]
MEIIIRLVERCACFGAGCASVGACYQPKMPKELK